MRFHTIKKARATGGLRRRQWIKQVIIGFVYLDLVSPVDPSVLATRSNELTIFKGYTLFYN